MKTKLNLTFSKILGLAFVVNPSLKHIDLDAVPALDPPMLKPFEDGSEDYKTPQELEEFFASHGGARDSELQNFLDLYKARVLSASVLFELPYSFHTCLIYKESRFDKEAKSYMGALGIAQFTPQTYGFLMQALRKGKYSLLAEVYKTSSSSSLVQDESVPLSASGYHLYVFKKMYKLWEAYLAENDLKEVDLSSKYYRAVLLDPDYAIGLSAAYIYYLNHRVKFSLSDYDGLDEISKEPDFYLSLAGAYNQGARRLLRAIKRGGSKVEVAQWIGHQSRIKETRRYIQSIKTCMTSTSKVKTDYAAQQKGKSSKAL